MNRANKWLISLLALTLLTGLLLTAGAPGLSAREFQPRIAPLNQRFLEYLREREAGVQPVEIGPKGHLLMRTPSPVDWRHLKRLPVDPALQPTATKTPRAPRPLRRIPAAFDWRSSKGYDAVSPVKDQGPLGDCWSFAAIAALEALHKIQDANHADLDLSENNMTSCLWPWLLGRDDGGNTAVSSGYLVNLFKKNSLAFGPKGALLESQDPYDPFYHNANLCGVSRPDPTLRVEGFRWVAQNTAAMKTAIYNYGPLITAFYYSDAYYDPSTFIYYCPNNYYGSNHEVVIVGWDDNRTHPGGKGCWIVKNSWGPDWGDQGYFHIPYNTGSVGEDNMYFTGLRNAAANENIYMEDQPGLIFPVGWILSTAYGAIVFSVPHATETLTHVEFYTTSNNARYTLKVFGAVTEAANGLSFSGQLATLSGTCQEAGYYSIPLPKPLILTGGKKYGVEVKFSTPGFRYPLPAAAGYPGLIDKSFIGNGTALSYGKGFPSSKYTRVAYWGSTMAVCIRARTTY